MPRGTPLHDTADPARRADFWMRVVAPRLVESGFGELDKGSDGWGFKKALLSIFTTASQEQHRAKTVL